MPKTKESGIDLVAYQAAILQRNRYREERDRLRIEGHLLGCEMARLRGLLREAVSLIPSATWDELKPAARKRLTEACLAVPKERSTE